MEYEVETYRWSLHTPRWGWRVLRDEIQIADGRKAPDEPTARKCAQAVIDALSPQPPTPTDADREAARMGCSEWIRSTSLELARYCTGDVSTLAKQGCIAAALVEAETPTTPTDADFAAAEKLVESIQGTVFHATDDDEDRKGAIRLAAQGIADGRAR